MITRERTWWGWGYEDRQIDPAPLAAGVVEQLGFGRADPEFWEAHWRGDEGAARAHAERNERLLEELWLPGGWAGRYGHYASQLKALMAILGQPGGTVRRPRLPVTDEASLDALREILERESLVPAEAGR